MRLKKICFFVTRLHSRSLQGEGSRQIPGRKSKRLSKVKAHERRAPTPPPTFLIAGLGTGSAAAAPVEVAFSPDRGATELVVKTIASARRRFNQHGLWFQPRFQLRSPYALRPGRVTSIRVCRQKPMMV